MTPMGLRTATTALLGLLLTAACATAAAAASSKSTGVSLTVDSYYNVVSSGSANLNISSITYGDEAKSYNFIGESSPDYGQLTLTTNTPWGIRCRLDANLPTTPGDGVQLRVDDDRGNFDASGWSAPLSTADTQLDFANDGSVTNGVTYNLDWRVEDVESKDGKPIISRIATFTVFASGTV
jgi:hypothetical protein